MEEWLPYYIDGEYIGELPEGFIKRLNGMRGDAERLKPLEMKKSDKHQFKIQWLVAQAMVKQDFTVLLPILDNNSDIWGCDNEQANERCL